MPPTPLKKAILMGLPFSGKTSIAQVVFDGKDPYSTRELETSIRITKKTVAENAFIKFQVWDMPGQLDDRSRPDLRDTLDHCGVIVFVIDANHYIDEADFPRAEEAEARLLEIITSAYQVNPQIHFEVFLHKVDSLLEEQKPVISTRMSRSINEGIRHQLDGHVRITYHQTSIYDYSVVEAFSAVVQRIVPQVTYVQEILGMFKSNCQLDRAMLFDMTSRICVVPDEATTGTKTFETFVEALNVLVEMSKMWGNGPRTAASAGAGANGLADGATTDRFAIGGHRAVEYERQAHCLIHLTSGGVVYVREVSPTLAIVVSGREAEFANRSLIDYNASLLRDAIVEMFTSAPIA